MTKKVQNFVWAARENNADLTKKQDSALRPAAVQLRSQQANPKGLSGMAGLRDWGNDPFPVTKLLTKRPTPALVLMSPEAFLEGCFGNILFGWLQLYMVQRSLRLFPSTACRLVFNHGERYFSANYRGSTLLASKNPPQATSACHWYYMWIWS